MDADAEGERVLERLVTDANEQRLELAGAMLTNWPWRSSGDVRNEVGAVSRVCRRLETKTSVGLSGEWLRIARYVGLFIVAIRRQ